MKHRISFKHYSAANKCRETKETFNFGIIFDANFKFYSFNLVLNKNKKYSYL